MSLAQAFAAARAEDRAALICYLPAGFPDAPTSVALIDAMVDAGADVVEVGLPYSDPLMDGPVIQQAVDLALGAGTTTDTVLQIVREVSGRGAQIAVMSYWNPIERYGVERFAEALVDSGGVAVITPDLTPEEAGPWIAATDAAGVERVFLVAPSSTDERIGTVAGASSGFVYAASTMGVTGARATLGTAAGELVGRVRPRTQLPIAVGVGVSTPEQAREVAGYADGVIVGSALVRAALDAPDRDSAVAAVATLTAALAEGVRR